MIQIMTFPDLIGKTGLFCDGDWVESKDQDPDGDVRLVQLADVGVGRFINKSSRFMTPAKARELKCTYLESGDILIARMPDPIGRACLFPGDLKPCVTVVDVCIIRVDPKIVHSHWLVHFINSANFQRQITNNITGTTRQRISRGNLAKVAIPLPSLEEQKRIAAILDKADAIRRKRQQAIALTDQLLRSVFLELFGDPVTNPKGWEVAPLSRIVNAFEGGKNVKPDESGNPTINRVLKVSAVTSGIFRPDESKPLPNDFEPPESYFVKGGDLLISRANTSELIGATAFVSETPEGIVLPDKIWRFIWKNEKNTHPLYVHYLFKQSHIRREISIRSSGTSGSMKNIPKPKLLEILIPIPPVNEQNKFGAIVEKVINTHQNFINSQQEIIFLVNSLTQKAFDGVLTQQTETA